MAGDTSYVLIWFIYLASGAVFFLTFWKFTALLGRLPAWILRTFMAALILTPVFPRSEEETAVPALMAVALDTIASGPEAAARGLAALAAGMIVAVFAALILFLGLTFVRRGNSRGLRRDSAAKWRNRHFGRREAPSHRGEEHGCLESLCAERHRMNRQIQESLNHDADS